jgi:RHS repeat-associated protein
VDDRITSFAYDALGRRIAREDANGLTMFLHDIADVVTDIALDGERHYLHGLARDELFTVDGRPVVVDGLGSLLGFVDADGELRETLRYEPFGRTVSAASTPPRYGFTGREREDADLYYYRARYYHAGLGRFISEDPLGLPGGVNAYAYAFNDPVNVVDPTGLRTYVVHGVWPERAAFEDFAAALRTADPHTQTLSWNGRVFGGVVPTTEPAATQLMRQILAELDENPLGTAEKLNLVGFSGGGLVSATLAEMLRARGVKVDTVVTMGTPAQTPLTTAVPAQTRLLNFIGVADPLVSLRLHPRGTNYLILATHRARSYTENDAVLALVRREITR